ncbi:hypothetical protein Scep_024708 [Stephania cephalantha]|uniref:Uncharacterized protein n=1 Tax=Stephania cephalantha TaxID=152367 RepID=A0AAP0HTY6_9MAGN
MGLVRAWLTREKQSSLEKKKLALEKKEINKKLGDLVKERSSLASVHQVAVGGAIGGGGGGGIGGRRRWTQQLGELATVEAAKRDSKNDAVRGAVRATMRGGGGRSSGSRGGKATTMAMDSAAAVRRGVRRMKATTDETALYDGRRR